MEENTSTSKGAYKKICACGCNQEFSGRRNQKFISEEHKSRFNNEKRAQRLSQLSGIFSEMENNYRILKKYYSKYKDVPTPFYLLVKEGFNPNAPFVMAKGFHDGEEYKAIADMMYRYSSRTKEHVIIEINENENY